MQNRAKDEFHRSSNFKRKIRAPRLTRLTLDSAVTVACNDKFNPKRDFQNQKKKKKKKRTRKRKKHRHRSSSRPHRVAKRGLRAANASPLATLQTLHVGPETVRGQREHLERELRELTGSIRRRRRRR
ncbi:hypothetical protein EUGRSUZ_H01743 [Eucalyptus grandis]|uniref:Uncharacterized protein n=2 Tax=Eucalyptus grandis TaxID=71139 RepID=A0ACC3JRV3_EUCGR|nr:hypothetical protein EUGRSUZ_H01743 [Eucalyptus grandis]